MTSSIYGAGSEPFLISSYTTQRNNKQVILELWGSKETITKGIVKDLEGKQLSEILPSHIYKGEGQSITSPALLTYIKVTQLSPVLHTLGKKCIVWLVPSLGASWSSVRDIVESDDTTKTIVNWEEEKASLQKIIPSNFIEDNRLNCRTREDLIEFGNKLTKNGKQAHQDSYLPQAADWFVKALFISIFLEDKKSVGNCFRNLGTAYQFLGEYSRAIQYHEMGLKISLEVKDRLGEGIAYRNLGITHRSLGNDEKSIEQNKKHLTIAMELKDRAEEGIAYGNLGIAHDNLGKYKEAIECHEKLLEIAVESKNQTNESSARIHLGKTYLSQGDHQEAIRHFEEGLKIAINAKNQEGEGVAYSGLGKAYHSLGKYQEAIKYHNKHLTITTNTRDRSGEAAANYHLGYTYFEDKKYSKSEKALIQSIKIYSEIQANLEHDEWKISIFEEQSKPYRLLQYNYFTTDKIEKALAICEKERARALFDLYCNRMQLSMEARGSITLEKMRAIAKREKTSFVYFSRLVNSKVHVWVVKENEMHGKKIELSEDFKTKALPSSGGEASRQSLIDNYLPDSRGLSFKLKSSFKKEKEPGESTQLSEDLEKCYQSLITPIEEWLDGERLTIITDATMRDVPFAALYKNGPNGREYLIDKYTISMAPSVRIFDLLHELKPLNDGSALIVADPDIKEKRLNGAIKEGKELAQKIRKPTHLSDKKATVAAVKQAASNASILHFACHGSADARISRYSIFEGGLCLTDSKGEEEIFFADEIQKLDLKADLVFLSACQTGKGAELREGVIGLSRAFLGAGVPSVIATHWNIDDHITQEIVSDFYTNLLDKGMTKAKALRHAMLKQRLAYPDKPHLWGAFFLIGK